MSKMETIREKINSLSFENASVLLTYTDRFEVYTLLDWVAQDADEDKLLDLRVFDQTKEVHFYRDYVGEEFSEYTLSDDDESLSDSYDDEQFVDLDQKRSKAGEGFVFATGGGKYRFPYYTEKDANWKVRIRNYLKFDECGQAQIIAWRFVEFYQE